MKIFKKLCLIAMAIFVAVGSLFVGFNLKAANTTRVASADIVVGGTYTFLGSNTITLPIYYNSVNAVQEFRNFNFRVSFRTLSGGSLQLLPLCSYFEFGNGISANLKDVLSYYDFENHYLTSFDPFGLGTGSDLDPSILWKLFDNQFHPGEPSFGDELLPISVPFDSNFEIRCVSSDVSINTNNFRITIFAQSGFNSNVQSIRLYLAPQFLDGSSDFSLFKPLHICYFDNNGKSLTFQLVVPQNYPFNDRTYYLSPDFSSDDIYQSGYQNGYTSGIADNQQNVYNKGYNAGKTAGYGNGYNDGVNAAGSGNYTFLGLIGAVVDAPLKAFTSLFNFELLGVNLLSFFSSILTFGILAWIIKLVMGGR